LNKVEAASSRFSFIDTRLEVASTLTCNDIGPRLWLYVPGIATQSTSGFPAASFNKKGGWKPLLLLLTFRAFASEIK
jgi:hypothetical protein